MQPNWVDNIVDYFIVIFESAIPELPEWFNLLGLMGWPLGLCGLLVVAISIERFIFHIVNGTTNAMHKRKLVSQLETYKEHPKSLRDDFATILLSETLLSYISGIKLLRTIAAISPLLGLLGTILGIITAFKVIAMQTGPVSPNLIADGLWEAMLTTAVGMIVALPAMMFAYVFKYLADKKILKLSNELNHLSISYEVEKLARSEVIKKDITV